MIHTHTIIPAPQPLTFKLKDGRQFEGHYDGHEFRSGVKHYPVNIVGWPE